MDRKTLLGSGARRRWFSVSLFACTVMCLQSCGYRPTAAEISGIWIGEKNAELDLRPDGTFTAKGIPAALICGYGTTRKIFQGKGAWKIEEDQGSWQVSIEENQDSLMGERSIGSYSVLISGTNGILENKPPWYLFEWVGEEGGPRYEFSKKK